MLTKKQLEKCNDLLRRELGSTPHGDPLFMWKWADELLRPMPTGEVDWKANIEGGAVLLPKNVMQLRKVAPWLNRQWVLCRWTPPPMSRDDWYREFGSRYDFPRRGEWVPTNMALPPDIDPDVLTRGQTFTERMIGLIKQQLNKTFNQLEAEALEAIQKREAEEDAFVEEVAREAVPAFANVPGSKEHVSFPSVSSEQDPAPATAGSLS